jgi:hypothetical protein
MSKGGNFYGDGNNVDFSQRYAPSEADNSGGDDAERWVGILRKAEPNHWAWKDSQQTKRVTDELRMSLAGKGTTAEAGSLLRQGRPENGQPFPTDGKIMPAKDGEDIDEYAEQAERMTRNMERTGALNPYGQFAHPQKRMAFVEELAERLRNPNGNGQKKVQPQNPEEEPFSSEKFWSNPEELKKAGKMVRPRKL